MAVYPEKRKGRLTGKWIAEFTRNGVRVARKRFDTKKEGDDWEGYMKMTGSPPPQDETFETGPTFADVSKEVEAQRTREGRNDISGKLRVAWLVEHFGTRLVKNIRTTDLDELVTLLLKKPVKNVGRSAMTPATVNRYLSEVSKVMKHAVDRKYREDLPKIPWMKEDGKRLHWLTEEQEEAVCGLLAEQGHPEYATLVRSLTTTGMRWGELAGLRPDQIEDNWVRLWKTKNGDERSVAITPGLAHSLREFVKAGLPSYSTFRKYYRSALRAAGLPLDISIHCLRHTTATRLVQRGVNLRIVQRYMGHRDISTTTRYAHVTDDDLQNALEKLSPHAGQGPKIAPHSGQEVPDFIAADGIKNTNKGGSFP